jgi:hypothetical protein
MVGVVEVESVNQHAIEQRRTGNWKFVLDADHGRLRSLAKKTHRLQRFACKVFTSRRQRQTDAV